MYARDSCFDCYLFLWPFPIQYAKIEALQWNFKYLETEINE